MDYLMDTFIVNNGFIGFIKRRKWKGWIRLGLLKVTLFVSLAANPSIMVIFEAFYHPDP